MLSSIKKKLLHLKEALTDKESANDKGGERQEDLGLFTSNATTDLEVLAVMTPRNQIVALPAHSSLESIVDTFATSKHTRVPVYAGNLDNIVGFIHLKDLITHLNRKSEKKEFKIDNMIHRVISVPGSVKISELLVMMRKSRVHAAVVVDEYGGTEGLVTLSDLIEEIFGEIEDEHEKMEEDQIVSLAENVFSIKARTLIADIEKELKVKLKNSEGFYTLGGLILELTDRIPTKNEVIIDPTTNIKFKVVAANDRMVETLEVDLSNYSPRGEASEEGTT